MDESIELINVFEVPGEGGRSRHLLGFQDVVLAKSKGLKSHAMVGEFEPNPDGSFNPDTFRINPEFVAAFEGYMSFRSRKDPKLIGDASEHPGEPMYVIDERYRGDGSAGVPMSDVLGHYEVDPTGAIVADSFRHNPKHLWFCPETGVSAVFYDREFYALLHPEYLGGPMSLFQHEGDELPADD